MASILVRDNQLDGSLPLIDPPCCEHGPTLLFTNKQGESNWKNKRKNNLKKLDNSRNSSSLSDDNNSYYYACSVSRDHKFCPFRLDRDRWIGELQSNQINIKHKEQLNRQQEFQYLLNEKDSSESGFGFCHDCCRILVDRTANDDEDDNIFEEHRLDYHRSCKEITSNVGREFFAKPSKLLLPQTSNENQAQYFFSDSVVKFLIESIIVPFEFDRILCIGCPTIHEQICSSEICSARSLLLDIDARFGQFYSAKKFVRFNMFNNHFFDESGKRRLRKFLSKSNGEKILLLIDPPFGGLIECLADTIKQINVSFAVGNSETQKYPISTILFFPYFNEHWIKRSFGEELKITDFIVTYRNHTKFNGKKLESSVLSSPVRIFTNIEMARLDFTWMNHELKIDSLYRWCSICSRYIFKTNKHCMECNECSARDASKSVHHCKSCGHCVKNTWKHCDRCSRCHLHSPDNNNNNCKPKNNDFGKINNNKKSRKY